MRKVLSIILITGLLLLVAPPVHAANLDVDFGNPPVAPGAPVFIVHNMFPGDTQERQIKVKNNTASPMAISIIGTKVSETKEFADILDVEIFSGATFYYGGAPAKKLEQFFTDSASGLFLFTLPGNSDKTFRVKVQFPTSAGNDYQGAEVQFDLEVGTTLSNTPTFTPTPSANTPTPTLSQGNQIVINEVYYDVDNSHGFDSPKDRGILGIHGNNLTIANNGSNSTNTINVSIQDLCLVVQQNDADVRNAVNVYLNSGNNNNGNSKIKTGNNNFFQQLLNFLNFNLNLGSCNGKKLGQDDEWVELYNPTNQEISLKNWTITDNSGDATIIHPNKKIPAHGFALLSKDGSLWHDWSEPGSAQKIELGQQFGDGLDNTGDRLILKNPQGTIIDQMAWQNDTSIWNPAAIDVAEGHSLERIPDGFDTNSPSDFHDQNPPGPGN